MIKNQMPDQIQKSFDEFKLGDIIQSPNGNLFIKIASLQALAIGPYEGLGRRIPQSEMRKGSPIVDCDHSNKMYIKVGKMKFKKKFLKYILENEIA